MFPIISILGVLAKIFGFVVLTLVIGLVALVVYRFYGDAVKRRLHRIKENLKQGLRFRITIKSLKKGFRRISLTVAVCYYGVNSALRPWLLACFYVVVVILALWLGLLILQKNPQGGELFWMVPRDCQMWGYWAAGPLVHLGRFCFGFLALGSASEVLLICIALTLLGLLVLLYKATGQALLRVPLALVLGYWMFMFALLLSMGAAVDAGESCGWLMVAPWGLAVHPNLSPGFAGLEDPYMLEQLLRVSYRDFLLGFMMEPSGLVPEGPLLDHLKTSGINCVYRIPSKEEFDLMVTHLHAAGYYSRSDLVWAMFLTLEWAIISPSPAEMVGDLGFGPVCGDLGGPGLHGYPGYVFVRGPEEYGLDPGFTSIDTVPPPDYRRALVPFLGVTVPLYAMGIFELYFGGFGSLLAWVCFAAGSFLGASMLDLGCQWVDRTHKPWIFANLPGDRSLFTYNYLEDCKLVWEAQAQWGWGAALWYQWPHVLLLLAVLAAVLSFFYMARSPDEPEDPPKNCPHGGKPSLFLGAYCSLRRWLRRRGRALRQQMWHLRRVLERAYADPRGVWQRLSKSCQTLWDNWRRGPRD